MVDLDELYDGDTCYIKFFEWTATNVTFVFFYVKPIILNLISKKWTNIQRQVINPRHQTPQGHPVAKPGTLL